MIQITPTSDIFYLEYSKDSKVIQNKILTLSKGTSLITNANCEDFGLFTKEGLNEVIVSDTLQGLQARIDSLKLIYSEEMQAELFPYPDLNIRVFIEHKAITAMIESPAKLLIEYALTCTRNKDEVGYTIWLSRLKNPQKSAAEVEGILRSFGAQILFSEHYVPEETQTILDSIYTSVVDGASYVWSGVTYIWDSVTGWFK
jgi:hypothetical protein